MSRRLTKGLAFVGATSLALAAFLIIASVARGSSDRNAPVTTLQSILNLVSGLRQPSNGQTRLLLLKVFAQASSGVTTGLSIFNTGRDPYGTVGVTGSCEIRFYGDDGPNPGAELIRVTPPIVPGTSYRLGLVSGDPSAGILPIPEFDGYAIATCGFPLAHAHMILIDATGVLATGQAVILPSTRSTSFVETASH